MSNLTYDPREPFARIDGGGCLHTGATMLDWYAGQALIGLLANSEGIHAGAEPTISVLAGPTRGDMNRFLAERAFALAGAMMTARAALRPSGDGGRE